MLIRVRDADGLHREPRAQARACAIKGGSSGREKEPYDTDDCGGEMRAEGGWVGSELYFARHYGLICENKIKRGISTKKKHMIGDSTIQGPVGSEGTDTEMEESGLVVGAALREEEDGAPGHLPRSPPAVMRGTHGHTRCSDPACNPGREPLWEYIRIIHCNAI